jgi:ABC-type ATPase involved in cell division
MVIAALKQVGLDEKVNNLTNGLSGGQQQRVAIAIINTPQ